MVPRNTRIFGSAYSSPNWCFPCFITCLYVAGTVSNSVYFRVLLFWSCLSSDLFSCCIFFFWFCEIIPCCLDCSMAFVSRQVSLPHCSMMFCEFVSLCICSMFVCFFHGTLFPSAVHLSVWLFRLCLFSHDFFFGRNFWRLRSTETCS